MTPTERALSRVIYQYRDSEKFKRWLTIGPRLLEAGLYPALDKINNILSPDAVSGAQLDILGRIVGIDRPYVNYEILGYFGWQENANRNGWGADWVPREVGEAMEILMPDEFYRILVKSKIYKNNSDATIDSIIGAVEVITSTRVQSLNDNMDMTFSITFSDRLEIPARVMLQEFDIVPRPQGVKFSGFSDPEGGVYFGYAGDPNARNYGVAPYAEIF